MKYLLSKDHFLYLTLLSILVFLGAGFTGNALEGQSILGLKFFTGVLFLINSLIVYKIVFNFYKAPQMSLAIAALYLLAPIHLDAFIFPFLDQTILAESFLLLFFILLLENFIGSALILLLFAVLLNTKLIGFVVLIWFYKKIPLLQKALISSAGLIVLLYVSPLFYKDMYLSFSQLKTLFYVFESLIFPASFTLLDFSVVDSSYYNYYLLFLTLLLLLITSAIAIKKKYFSIQIITCLVGISCIGALVPFKQITVTENYFYYFLPSFYPCVLYAFLLTTAYTLSKIKSEVVFKFVAFFICLYWIAFDIRIEKSFQKNIVNEWDHSMILMSSSFKFEKEIKLKYVNVLIQDGQLDKAKKIINESKAKLPDLAWYESLLTIARRNNDPLEAERVYLELKESQIPYINNEYEN